MRGGGGESGDLNKNGGWGNWPQAPSRTGTARRDRNLNMEWPVIA